MRSVPFVRDACVHALASQAYAFLFALLAALAMHSIDVLVRAASAKATPPIIMSSPRTNRLSPPFNGDGEHCVDEHEAGSTLGMHSHGGAAVAHSATPHGKVLAAIMMEFGVTVHSIFIGLAVGVASDDDLRSLLVALVFHQFFEGVALGSRLAAADFATSLEATMSFVFTISAPVGIAIGAAIVGTSQLDAGSPTFLLTQGSFDGICGGILLYLGFGLLFVDFPRDLENAKGWRVRVGFMISLWTGAGLMAFIGEHRAGCARAAYCACARISWCRLSAPRTGKYL